VTTVTTICLAALAVSAVLCLLRLIRGRSLADRIVALDVLLIIVAIGIAVDAARTQRGTYLDALLVVTLIAFIGTTAVARFIERRGA
jgi:multicomponent Na+:H+ antiporter subunit F